MSAAKVTRPHGWYDSRKRAEVACRLAQHRSNLPGRTFRVRYLVDEARWMVESEY